MKKTFDDFGSAEPVDVLAILHVVDRGRVPKKTRNLPDGQKPEHQVLPNDRQKGVGQVIGLSRVSRGIPHLPIHNYYSVISMIESRNYIYTGNLEEDCSKKLVKDS